MARCLLCLQTNIGFSDYIPINSPQWFHFDILKIIEKHFWLIDNVQDKLGICLLCWSKLNDFHSFYGFIEKAHSENDPITMEEKINYSLEMGKYQINAPQLDIKVEETLNGNESLLCESTTIEEDNIDFDTISTEKRKRGRPRKKRIIIKETIKRKRGRPRKINLDINDNHTNTSFRNDSIVTYINIHQNDQETLQHTPLIKVARIGSPQKVKRSRGRPRKLQLNKESSNFVTAVNDLPKVTNEVLIDNQFFPLQSKGEDKDVAFNSNETEKLLHKKKKRSFIKKRKRVQQRTALMRNYIATSMRCMKFLKND